MRHIVSIAVFSAVITACAALGALPAYAQLPPLMPAEAPPLPLPPALPGVTPPTILPPPSKPFVCSNSSLYSFATNNCHTAANLNVLNGATHGVFRCSGKVGSQGHHTVNYTVQTVDSKIYIYLKDNNGVGCSCDFAADNYGNFPGLLGADGTPNVQIFSQNAKCRECLRTVCYDEKTEPPPGEPVGTFLPPGALDDIPGNAACVRETLHGGDSTNISAVGDYDDPDGKKEASCKRCCNRRFDTYYAMANPTNKVYSEEWYASERERIKVWYKNCRSLCEGAFHTGDELPIYVPNKVPDPAPTPPTSANTAPPVTTGDSYIDSLPLYQSIRRPGTPE